MFGINTILTLFIGTADIANFVPYEDEADTEDFFYLDYDHEPQYTPYKYGDIITDGKSTAMVYRVCECPWIDHEYSDYDWVYVVSIGAEKWSDYWLAIETDYADTFETMLDSLRRVR